MNTEIFCFCEFASQKGGSLSFQGAFDTWRTKTLPTQIPGLYIVIRTRLVKTNQKRTFNFQFLDPDGEPANRTREFTCTGTVANFIINESDLVFKKEGTYQAIVTHLDETIAMIPLQITNSPMQPTTKTTYN